MDADRPHAGGSSGSLSVVRAAAVLIVFVVAVSVLVAVGTRPSVSGTPSSATATTGGVTTTTVAGATTSTPTSTPGGAAASTTTTTTTKPPRHHGSTATSSTTTSTVAHGSVSVAVANGTSTNGLAAHFTQVLSGAGWQTQTPIDASTSVATSAVYYAAGQQPAAQEVASAIGVKPTQVQPLTTSVPVTGVTGTDVVVVIGQDLASGTTTTTAGS